MNNRKINKSLEYIDEIINREEQDGDNSVLLRDARKGYQYIKFILDQLSELEKELDRMEDALREATAAHDNAWRAFVKEPESLII